MVVGSLYGTSLMGLCLNGKHPRLRLSRQSKPAEKGRPVPNCPGESTPRHAACQRYSRTTAGGSFAVEHEFPVLTSALDLRRSPLAAFSA